MHAKFQVNRTTIDRDRKNFITSTKDENFWVARTAGRLSDGLSEQRLYRPVTINRYKTSSTQAEGSAYKKIGPREATLTRERHDRYHDRD